MISERKFKTFIAEIKFSLYAEFRRRVVFECAISEQTFRNWQRGIYEPDEDKRKTVDRIAFEITGKHIYNKMTKEGGNQ